VFDHFSHFHKKKNKQTKKNKNERKTKTQRKTKKAKQQGNEINARARF